MLMNLRLPLISLFFFLVVALSLACAEPPKRIGPVFQVVSLKVTPGTVSTNQEAAVTALIQNAGQVEGDYIAVLTVDGKKFPARTINIPAESTKRVAFTLTRDTPGEYELSMGKASATLIVKKFVRRDVELAYGSGEPRDALYSGANSGHLIDFTPPDKSFTLKKLRICGGIYGSGWHGQNFELYVLDRNFNIVINQTLPITVFPQREVRMYQLPMWRELEIQPTGIAERFYVYLYTDTPRLMGLHIGADSSIPNEHSDIATGMPPDLTIQSMQKLYPGQWCAERVKVNWLIQAIGSTYVSE